MAEAKAEPRIIRHYASTAELKAKLDKWFPMQTTEQIIERIKHMKAEFERIEALQKEGKETMEYVDFYRNLYFDAGEHLVQNLKGFARSSPVPGREGAWLDKQHPEFWAQAILYLYDKTHQLTIERARAERSGSYFQKLRAHLRIKHAEDESKEVQGLFNTLRQSPSYVQRFGAKYNWPMPGQAEQKGAEEKKGEPRPETPEHLQVWDVEHLEESDARLVPRRRRMHALPSPSVRMTRIHYA